MIAEAAIRCRNLKLGHLSGRLVHDVAPHSLIAGIFLEAYPSKQFRSAWMGIIVHSLASIFIIVVVLGLVLK